ncbi:MAG: DUF1624 domain-containing protein [Crocinitomicaceae bacterium]|nr:DUF1624 domain-containing protein [Crocinitomicaceae bacterium]
MENTIKKTPLGRLKFIDAARSIAIILMLQGHFIALTFEDYYPMIEKVRSGTSSGNILFDYWCRLRGFTAPLFFTVTGVIFVFLLLKDNSESFWQQKRVKKGIRRAFTIILWGYLLQANFASLDYYLAGKINSRLLAFHVLQCIGFGILVLILLYGIQRSLKRISLLAMLLVMSMLVFLLHPILKSLPKDVFSDTLPVIIQNMIRGPNSVFPLIPWLGYVLFGGVLGYLLRKYHDRLLNKWFPLQLFVFGLSITFLGRILFYTIDWCAFTDVKFIPIAPIFDRLSQITGLLSLLLFLERVIGIRNGAFLLMGQNTLVIYILHVILLYGAIIGIGVKSWCEHSLTFLSSIIGAISFIIFFGILTYTQDKLQVKRRNRIIE